MRIFAFLILVVFLTVCAYAQEDITITTYYPSPAGSYRDLSVANNLAMGKTPVGTTSSSISWRTTNDLRWNLEQNNDRLRFFTTNNTNSNSQELVSLYPETTLEPGTGFLLLQGKNKSFDLILRGGSTLKPSDAGDLIFQHQSGAQKGRIWSEYDTDASGLRLSSGDNAADIAIDSNGNVGIGTDKPGAKIDVNGGVKIGTTNDACDSTRAGTVIYDSGTKVMKFCNGSNWLVLGGSIKTETVSEPEITYATCSSGYVLTGGGCLSHKGALVASVPSTCSGGKPCWRCKDETPVNIGARSTAYAICAKVE